MTTAVKGRPRARRSGRWRYPITPTPRQAEALATYADEILFGGAAGPGKSEWLLLEAIILAVTVPGSASVLFRRTFRDLDRPGGLILRLLARLPASVATYNKTEHRWTFRNGSVIELAHLERDSDVAKYQGAEYQLVGFDELTQFTEWQYRYMTSRLRAAGDVARRMAELGLRPRIVAATNPGHVGHGWVRARFIDPAPPGIVWLPEPTLDEPTPGTRAFIPGLLTDNPFLDEAYRRRLNNLPIDERRALLYGDWDVFAGQRFREWDRAIHVIEPEDLPISLGGMTRALGVDYGLDAPYCALWGAKLPDNGVVVYREDVGAGYTPREQAARILGAEAKGERTRQRVIPVYLDPATWARNPSDTAKRRPGDRRPPKGSIAGIYAAAGLPVKRAHNDRIAGAALVADKLRVREDGRPRLYVYSTCRYLIKTLPALIRDDKRPEDVDTDGDDHGYDALRYLLAGLDGMGSGTSAEPQVRGRAPVTGDRTMTGSIRKASF